MASSLTCVKLTAWILVAVLLQMLGLSFFVIGFFPVKPTLHGKSGVESYRMPTCDSVEDSEERDVMMMLPEQLRSLYTEMSEIPPAYDRLILMVVDGLPAEFVLGRGDKPPSKSMMEAMPYTQSLLSSRRAVGYHARAAPPTVTMPRLKAMVSGAIGGFLDVAFNFNTQAFLDDNLLDKFYHIGWKMVMLGDETWIKLFPQLFSRQDGVSSFFVKDTVEVDFNVSRHLEVELVASDWNLLILHYLGLDHVGHIGGRRSMLMVPKLKEMDEVIKMIHMHNILDQDTLDKRTLLVVVSDHGMTDGGNHGGSSYEETDSLALFIGGEVMMSQYASNAHKTAFQVDVTPTLALLFGVPIPKNNIGVILMEVLGSLSDKQRLRALEVNSWQILRLLQAHLPGYLCGNLNDEEGSHITGTNGTTQERLYHLFSRALATHKLWELHQQVSDLTIINADELKMVINSYYEFMRNASEWLSHRATDKPFNLLLSGVAILIVSSILLVTILFCLLRRVLLRHKRTHFQLKEYCCTWHFDEAFVCLAIAIHVISLGSSSMVEEEQYTCNFLASTLYLIFLLSTIQTFLKVKSSGSTEVVDGKVNSSLQQPCLDASSSFKYTIGGSALLKSVEDYYQIVSILIVLICGRLLRGWHQGGVNWVDLPDISKWLEQAGVSTIIPLHLTSLLLLMIFYSYTISLLKSRTMLINLAIFGHLASGTLVGLHIMKNWSSPEVLDSHSSTFLAKIFYVTVGVTMVVTVFLSPWFLPVHDCRAHLLSKSEKDSRSSAACINSLLPGIKDSMYLIGMTYTSSWCLLQLLLQQPINSVPVILILIQLFASMIYFSADGSCHEEWVEVVALHFLGMAGHFALGNSNSLATIDVAGAFIGISSHSTLLSGILMFSITYASPVLSFLSMVIYPSVKDRRCVPSSGDLELDCILQRMIAVPCLLPLVVNSVVLTVFTIVLLLMRNHLFIWSVFSPKYLYICAMTASVYIGVFVISLTGFYVCIVFLFRSKMLHSHVSTS